VKVENPRIRPEIIAPGLALLGLAPLWNALHNPRLASAHVSDMLQLLAAGFCFGGAWSLFMTWINARKHKQ
jgi:hypothetical protein